MSKRARAGSGQAPCCVDGPGPGPWALFRAGRAGLARPSSRARAPRRPRAAPLLASAGSLRLCSACWPRSLTFMHRQLACPSYAASSLALHALAAWQGRGREEAAPPIAEKVRGGTELSRHRRAAEEVRGGGEKVRRSRGGSATVRTSVAAWGIDAGACIAWGWGGAADWRGGRDARV